MLLLSLNKACTTKQQKQNVTLMQPKGSLVGSCSKTVPSRREMGVTVSITCGCVCRRAVVRSFVRSRVEARGPQKEPNKLRTTKLPSASNASAPPRPFTLFHSPQGSQEGRQFVLFCKSPLRCICIKVYTNFLVAASEYTGFRLLIVAKP